MPIALPLVTRREIAREYRPDGTVTEDSAVRRLRRLRALSAGVSVEARAQAGRLGGRLHLYSALDRDAARAVRHRNDRLAIRIAQAAAVVEGSVEARRLADALSPLGGAATAAQLARTLSASHLARDVAELQIKHQKARARLGLVGGLTLLSGHVASISPVGAMLAFSGLPGPFAVPGVLLSEAGLDAVGAAVSATWEVLPGGRTLLTVEPAVDAPEVNELGEPLIDLYGTPWGRVLADPDALRVSGTPTVSIPEGIPQVA